MKPVKAVLFDIGGVVLRHPKSPNTVILINIFHKSYEETSLIYNQIKSDYFTGKIITDTFINKLIILFNSNLTVDEVKQLWQTQYRNMRTTDDEIISVIKLLKEKSILVGALTNTTPITYDVNQKAGIYDYFDRQYVSFKIGFTKPNPEIYRYALNDLNLPASSCLFIDDKPENIDTAKKLRFQTIKFDNLIDNETILKAELKKIGITI
jgi:HAD superfamily hydrolase (TIGR01509 family)